MELAPLRCTLPQLAFWGERHSLRTPLATPLDWVSLVVVATQSVFVSCVFRSSWGYTVSRGRKFLFPNCSCQPFTFHFFTNVTFSTLTYLVFTFASSNPFSFLLGVEKCHLWFGDKTRNRLQPAGAGYAPSADVLKNIVPPPPAVTLQSTGPVPPQTVPPREAAAGAESGRATSSSAGLVVVNLEGGGVSSWHKKDENQCLDLFLNVMS